MRPPRGDHPSRGETRHTRTIRELQELVAALDRRVPQVERVGEASIARAAAALRAAAVKRMEELGGAEPRASGPPPADR